MIGLTSKVDNNNVSDKNPNVMPDEQNEERYFLEGPKSRWKEFKFLIHIIWDFLVGFRILHFAGPCVTVFGSARFKEDHPFYKKSFEVSKSVAGLGFTVMTGGGPGVMEAANKGAKSGGGKSVGCNIILPMEQYANPWLDLSVNIKYFFVRKVLLCKYSYAFVCMPGGMGTLDEFFEAVTLVQTNKIKRFPIVLFGKEYHKHLYKHIQYMADAGTISPKDLELFLFTDDIEEMELHLIKYAVDGFGLKKVKKMKRWAIFGE